MVPFPSLEALLGSIGEVGTQVRSGAFAQAGVSEADVHRVGVIAQVDAVLQIGQRLVDAYGDSELMATLEVEEGVIVQVEGDGGAM